MKTIFIVILIGYFIGCFQTSYFIGKIFKKTDIRTLGNKNAGASNITIAFGWKYGLFVAITDILKPIISIFIIRLMFFKTFNESDLMFLIYLNGLFVILGHNYPFFLNFKGGKGTASLIGLLFAINIKFGLIGLLTMIIVSFATDYIVLGTISLTLIFLFGTIFLNFNIYCIYIALFITILGIYKHIPNIKNIINKKEPGLRKSLKK